MRHGCPLIASALIALSLGACESTPGFRSTLSDKDTASTIKLRATAKSMYVGETMTVQAITQNTMGKEAKIEWYSPEVKLVPEEGGARVRVKAERLGDIHVRATLVIPGAKPVDDAITIEVKPLP